MTVDETHNSADRSAVGATAELGVPDDVLALLPRRRIKASTRRKIAVNVTRLLVFVALLLAWEVLSGPPGDRFVQIDEFYVSQPSDIWNVITQWWSDGTLVDNAKVTLQEALVGFMFGTAGGLVFGFLFGVNRFIGAVASPFVMALNSVPRLALVPLFTIWFGLGIQAKYALVTTIVFFLVFYNTYAGVRDVSGQLLDVLRIMDARRWQLHAKVTLPSAAAWIIAGLRISVPYALLAAVTAEMLGSSEGMGYLIVRAASQFNTAAVFAAIIVLVVMALALNGIVTLLERYLLAWKGNDQQTR